MINTAAAQAKVKQVSNILKLASFGKITINKAAMFLITSLRDLPCQHHYLERIVRQQPLAALCPQGKIAETGYRELIGRSPNSL
jgi:hypothetical protein